MKPRPLNDLEMHELLRLMYQDHIRSDEDEYFNLSQTICNESTVDLGNGFKPLLADLLGRMVMLTMPMSNGTATPLSHCIGPVTMKDGAVQMTAVVRRDAT